MNAHLDALTACPCGSECPCGPACPCSGARKQK